MQKMLQGRLKDLIYALISSKNILCYYDLYNELICFINYK